MKEQMTEFTQNVAEMVAEPEKKVNELLKYFQDRLPVLIDLLVKIALVLAIFFIGKKIINWLLRIIKRSFIRAGLEEGSIHFLLSLIKALMYVILVSSLATYMGVKEASIAALLGSMGVGIVLALKESLSNLAGGVILLLMKPFVVGDYIREDGHGNEGTVHSIDLFYTKLITPDNQVVSLPNGILSNTSMTNVTKQDKRQLRMTVGISYDADIKEAKAVLEEILRTDEKVMQSEPIDVFVDELADSSVQIGFRAWLAPDDYWPAKWRITETVKYAFDAKGISIPYKQIDVHVASENTK